MKSKLLPILLFIATQTGYSQIEKRIIGTVLCNDFALEGIEVLNLETKNTTITNVSGNFTVLAKVGDDLMFVSKNYNYKTITLKQADFDNGHFIISLTKKPEELEEVMVFKMPTLKLSKDKAYEQGKLDELALEKATRSLNTGVYNHTIQNGIDFVRIGKMVLAVFIKEKKKVKKVPEIKFKTLVSSSLDQEFFKKILLLKPEDIAPFLDFCDADATSKNVLDSPNILKTIDFLVAKNEEFKKLPLLKAEF